MARYVKRAIAIEAEQWRSGLEDCWVLIDEMGRISESHDTMTEAISRLPIRPGTKAAPGIYTLEGIMAVCLFPEPDFIITGVMGERYPCRASIFRKTYDSEKGSSETTTLYAVCATNGYREEVHWIVCATRDRGAAEALVERLNEISLRERDERNRLGIQPEPSDREAHAARFLREFAALGVHLKEEHGGEWNWPTFYVESTIEGVPSPETPSSKD